MKRSFARHFIRSGIQKEVFDKMQIGSYFGVKGARSLEPKVTWTQERVECIIM